MAKLQQCSNVPTEREKKSYSGEISTGLLPSKLPSTPPPEIPLENTTIFSEVSQSRDLYKLRDISAKVIKDHRVKKDHRVCYCGKQMLGQRVGKEWKEHTHVEVIKNIYDKIHYNKLMKCGSVWVCPICNYRIGVVRRIEIGAIIDKAKKEKKQIWHQTFTIRHRSKDDLHNHIENMAKTFAEISKQYIYQKFFRSVKYIRVLEITYTKDASGFHPHYHFLLICDILDKKTLNALVEEWCTRTGATKKNCKLKQCNSNQDIEEYITKFEIKQEMTNSQSKTRSLNFWGFLDCPEGNEKLIREYAKATKGKRSISWSKGIKLKQEDEILKISDKAVEVLLEIRKSVYFDTIVKFQLYKVILDSSENFNDLDKILEKYHVQRVGKELLPKNYLYSDTYPQINAFESTNVF